MSQHDDFDRALSRWLEADARPAATADVLDRSLRATSQRRPRPALFAAVGSHWVGDGGAASPGTAAREGTGLRTAVALLLVLLGLGLVAAAALVGAQLRQTPPVGGLGHLAYAMEDGLYIADWDGRNARRIVSLDQLPDSIPDACRAFFGGPSWSPDGRRLAIRTEWNDTCPGSILITDPDGSSVTAVAGAGWAIGWSPESSRIVTWIDFLGSIAVYGLDGQRHALLDVPASSGDHDPGWMPGGSAVHLLGTIVPLDGSAPYEEDRPLYSRAQRQLSPDGSWVAYTAGSAIILAATDGVSERAFEPAGSEDIAEIAWAPTGDRVAFRTAKGGLGSVDVATRTTTLLDAPLDEFRLAGYSPDDDRFLLATSPSTSGGGAALWLVQPDGSGPRMLVKGTALGSWQWLAAGPPPEPVTPAPSSPTETATPIDGMWPQATMAEVREAQALADTGDPRFTWQVSRDRSYQLSQNHPMSNQFFARFMQEVLGWEAFLWDEAFAHPDGLVDGDVIYVRCAVREPNRLYPKLPKNACAPTIDEFRYETVKIHVSQPVRSDPSGLWVVTDWEIVGSAEQAAPPSDPEINGLLDAFLDARIKGTGAEGLVEVADTDPLASERLDRTMPLLYATSTGAAYERSEFELVDGPEWPDGRMRFKVRLFAERGGTVVEQLVAVERDESGRLRLVYDPEPTGPDGQILATTEAGKAVPTEYAFLDGAVTYRAASPLAPSLDGYRGPEQLAIDGLLPDDDAPRRVLIMRADLRPTGPGCSDGEPPATAEALARILAADPDLDASPPVRMTIGGVPALRLDVTRAPGSDCLRVLEDAPFPALNRARLWLVDVPRGPARVLVMATITDDDSFDTVLEYASPVVDSIEFPSR